MTSSLNCSHDQGNCTQVHNRCFIHKLYFMNLQYMYGYLFAEFRMGVARRWLSFFSCTTLHYKQKCSPQVWVNNEIRFALMIIKILGFKNSYLCIDFIKRSMLLKKSIFYKCGISAKPVMEKSLESPRLLNEIWSV